MATLWVLFIVWFLGGYVTFSLELAERLDHRSWEVWLEKAIVVFIFWPLLVIFLILLNILGGRNVDQ